MAADRRTDLAPVLGDRAADDRPIDALRRLFPNLLGEVDMRPIVLRRHHDARRVLVEPVHDARPYDAVDARQVLAVMEQRIDERAVRCSRRRMDDHAARLVDDDDVRILVEDVQGDGFRQDLQLPRFGNFRLHGIPCAQLRVCLRRPAVDEDAAAFDQLLDMGARNLQFPAGEKAVETFSRSPFVDDQPFLHVKRPPQGAS